MSEVWKPVAEFLNYEVSDAGRVRSKPGWRAFGSNRRFVDSTVLKPRPQGSGYFFVGLWDGKRRNRYIHRLVASAFLPPDPDRHEVNHKNGDKGDNAASNLEWVTRYENTMHRARVLRLAIRENHGRAKLTQDQVDEIRKSSPSERVAMAAKFGIAKNHVTRLRSQNGTLWRD